MEIQIHLLNLLTKNSCSEKYNFRPKAGIAGRRLDFYCQGPIVVFFAAVPG